MRHPEKTPGPHKHAHNLWLAEDRPLTGTRRRKFFIAAIVLVLLGAAGFLGLLVSVETDTGIADLDEPVQDWIVDQRTPEGTGVMVVLANIFGPVAMPVIVLLITVIWFWRTRQAWRPVLLAGAMLLGVGLALTVRDLVQRPRPPLELMLNGADSTYSFPSGHVLAAADILLLSVYLIVSRRQSIRLWLTALSGAAFGIGTQIISRLYLGYHWLTDTLASVTLSMVVLGMVVALDTWRTTTVDEGPGGSLMARGAG